MNPTPDIQVSSCDMFLLMALLISGDTLVFCGNLSVMGLLILQYRWKKVKESDVGIYKFIQSVIRYGPLISHCLSFLSYLLAKA